MTNIKITHTDSLVCFSCTGHAGQAEKGKDIVCAGISALCVALLERLTQLESEDKTQIKKCCISDGSLVLYFTLTESSLECCKTVMCGFEFIAVKYPENCSLSTG